MGKRQVRIFRQDILLKKSEITGKDGHVITTDHVVHSGQILTITDHNLILRDLRSNNHSLALTAIEEVVYDKETDY